MSMIYLEDFIEIIEDLHTSVRDQLTDLTQQDVEVTTEFNKLETQANSIFEKLASLNPNGNDTTSNISEEALSKEFIEIFKNYKKLIRKSQLKVEITNNIETMIDRYLKHLENELAKFATDLNNDNPLNSSKLKEKAMKEIEEQKLKRQAEKEAIRMKEREKIREKREQEANVMKLLKSKHDIASKGGNSTAGEITVGNLSKLLLGDSNSQSTHKNKALSLEILIYQVKLPRKDKKSNLNRILPTEDDVEQAAKIASLLTHLSEDMQNSLASLLTNGDYKYWTKASIEKPKELLKAYLKYLATPIKDPKEYWWSSFRRDELYRYDSNLFDDETEMSQENSIKISRYNKLIDTVFLQQEKTMKDEKLRKKNKNKAVNLQKEMHLKNSQKTAKEICLLPPKIGSTNTGTMNPPAAVVTPQKNLSHSIEVIHSDSDPKNERLYCICNQYSYGNMIKCDNNFCKQEWFHYACVHVSSPPKGNWYCPNCANLEERSPIRHARARTFRQEAQPSKLTSEKRRKVE